MPPHVRQIMSQAPNQTRIARLCDCVLPGERVLDIGFGYGHVATHLLRDTQLAYYCGLDRHAHLRQATERMFAVNGVAEREHHLEVLDLFELGPAFVARHAPTLVVFLEVMEHLSDPRRALQVFADCMPGESELLFTVPMAGRMEHTWGHNSFFDVDRVVQLCGDCGFTLQWAELMFNAWQLLLVSRGRQVSPRIEQLRRTQPRPVCPDGLAGARVKELPLEGDGEPARSVWDYRSQEVRVERLERGVRCEVTAGADEKGGYGGLHLPAQPCAALRLMLSFTGVENILSAFVEGRDLRGERCCCWQWQPSGATGLPTQPRAYLFRPGRQSGPFRPVGSGDLAALHDVQVFLLVTPGQVAGLTLHRAAVVKKD